MTYDCFTVDIEDAIAHVVLNRPDKRNSMNPAFWRELPEIINDIDDKRKSPPRRRLRSTAASA